MVTTQNASQLVDKMIGSAYPVVKEVAKNLDTIKSLNSRFTEITNNIEEILVTASLAQSARDTAIAYAEASEVNAGNAATYSETAISQAVIATTQASIAVANAVSAFEHATDATNALETVNNIIESLPNITAVTLYGAIGDNIEDDAPEVQLTLDADLGGAMFPPGTYRMVPGNTSPFTLGNTVSNIYRAIAITESDLKIRGEGILHGVSRPGVQVADVQPIFSTNKNMTVGTLKNITFEGLTFDPANDADVSNSNQRFLYAVGVDGLRLLNLVMKSSGNRRGYAMHLQNSRNVQDIGSRHQKVTGGTNIRYVKNFVKTNFIYEDFSEAIDLDGTSDRVVIRHGVFEGTGRGQQCIDVNSQIDASLGDFSVYNVGKIIEINYKTTTPPTYAEYVANDPVTVFSVGKRIVVSGITGSAIGSDTVPSFYIGWDWAAGSHAGAGPVQDITIRDIDLDDVGFFYVREARNLRLENITLRNALSASGFTAVDLRSVKSTDDELAWSDLDVQIDKLRIENAQRGGLKIAAPSRAVINGLITKGNNSLGGSELDLRLSDLEARLARVTIDNCDIEGNVTIGGDSTLHTAWVLSTAYTIGKVVVNDGGKRYICTVAGTSAGAGGPTGTGLSITDNTVTWRYVDRPYSIIWGPNNRLRGTLTLAGDAHKFIYGREIGVNIGALAATGTVTRVLFVASRRCYIPRAQYGTSGAVVANGSNYRALQMAATRAAGSGAIQQIDTSSVGFSANTMRDAEFAVSEANAYLEPGDVLRFTSSHVGTGVAFGDLNITFTVLEY